MIVHKERRDRHLQKLDREQHHEELEECKVSDKATLIADGKKVKKVKCPYCDHEQNIFFVKGARCEGLFFKCKNKTCRKEFEIKI